MKAEQRANKVCLDLFCESVGITRITAKDVEIVTQAIEDAVGEAVEGYKTALSTMHEGCYKTPVDAQRAIAEEREACAKVCTAIPIRSGEGLAAAIRSRK